MTTALNDDEAAVAAPPSTAVKQPGRRLTLPDRPERVDLAAAGGLAALALSAFAPSFGGTTYLLMGGVGVLVGLGAVWALVKLRVSPFLAVLAVLVAFVAAGSIAVPDAAIAGFLPGPAVPSALFDGVVHGWARVVTTATPVGTSDGMGVIPYLCAFMAAAGALALARLTRLSMLPVVPPLLTLVAGILMGTDVPGSVLLQGALFAVVAIAWGSARATRHRAGDVGSAGRHFRVGRSVTVAAYLAVVAALALVVGPALPLATHAERYVLRQHAVPPFDPREYASPLSGYRHYRMVKKAGGERDVELLQVSGMPEDALLRVATLDGYDGVVFVVGGSGNVAAGPSGSGRFDRVGNGVADPAANGPGKDATLRVKVLANGARQPWVPLSGALRSIAFGGARGDQLGSSFRYNALSHMGATPLLLQPGDTYTAKVRLNVVPFDRAKRDAMIGDAKVDTGIPLAAVDGIAGFAKNARDLMGSASTTLAKIEAVESAFHDHGTFSDGSDDSVRSLSGHSIARLAAFFGKDPVVGDAEQYAAAMTVLLRTQGIPARVAMGYRSTKGVDSTQAFKGGDLQAWVEVPFVGVGWVPFFPTPTKPPQDEPKPKPKTIQTQTQAAPPTTYLQVQPPDPRENRRRGDTSKGGGGFQIPAVVVLAAKVIGVPVFALAAFAFFVTGIKRVRRKRRRTRGTPVEQVHGAWLESLDALRDHGVAVPRRVTRREAVAAIPAEQWPGGMQLATGIDAAMFGRDDPDAAVVEQVWSRLDEDVAQRQAGLDWKRRVRVKLNLASLRPGR